MNGITQPLSADSKYSEIKPIPPPAVSVVTFRWDKRKDNVCMGAPGRYRESAKNEEKKLFR